MSRLFDKLVPKLRSTALVVSDGSNCTIGPLRKFQDSRMPSAEVFNEVRDQAFDRWGLHWRFSGYMGRRYGPTLVWQVERLAIA